MRASRVARSAGAVCQETVKDDDSQWFSVNEAYTTALFNRYDDDNSGTIDQEEFRAIAQEMQDGVNRRTFIAIAASAFGAYAVAVRSEEYQFLQKVGRAVNQREPAAEATMRAAFPNAMLSYDADAAVEEVLSRRGFTPRNTLYAHSVCPDEVNAKSEELNALLTRRWGEAFTLGGLAGVPFAGRSGFRAYLHHCPDDGKLLIFLAPHVGVAQLGDGTGRVGALQRDGQSKLATACGAAVGAYKANKAELEKLKQATAASGEETVGSKASGILDSAQGVYDFDPQIEFIKAQLMPRLDGIENAQDEIAYVTYQLYTIARELLYAEIAATTDLYDWCNEIAVVGGVLINRAKGGDFFMPLGFQTRTKGGPVEDLYEEAFGSFPRSELGVILGSDDLAERVVAPSEIGLGGGPSLAKLRRQAGAAATGQAASGRPSYTPAAWGARSSKGALWGPSDQVGLYGPVSGL